MTAKKSEAPKAVKAAMVAKPAPAKTPALKKPAAKLAANGATNPAAKADVAVKGKPMRMLIQAVGTRVRVQYDRPWGSQPRMTQLVVIGERADIDAAAITAFLEV